MDFDTQSEGVEFIEEGTLANAQDIEREKHYSFIVRWLLKRGWAKTELQANLILVGVTIVSFAVSFYLFFLSTEYGTLVKPTISVERVTPSPSPTEAE